MKKILKELVIFLLHWRVKKLLEKSNAKVYGVTGSVGKTTCKTALAQVLKIKFEVLESSGGFNTRIGMLLSILGEESGFSSFSKWIGILIRSFIKKIKLPQKIILEYGVDKPGDMDKLIKIVRPDVAIITKIAPVHMAKGQFANVEEIAKEKCKLGREAKEIAVINEEILKQCKIKNAKCKIIQFGEDKNTDVQVKDLKEEKNGFSFSVNGQKFKIPSFGSFQYPSFLPAIICGLIEKINKKQIAKVLKKFIPAPGRGRIFDGKNESKIWDSSYNASPESVIKSLETLAQIPAKRKLALLGNMNELGDMAAEFHKAIGQKATEVCDEIFFVGKNSQNFMFGVNNQKTLTIFPNAEVAGERIKNILKKGDLILIKGSQNNVRLEKAVEKMLKNKKDVKMLCRRNEGWK